VGDEEVARRSVDIVGRREERDLKKKGGRGWGRCGVGLRVRM
jgi:hypothetical protein